MTNASAFALAVLLAAEAWTAVLNAADPPRPRPLDAGQRAALTRLLNAVDAAQARDPQHEAPPDDVGWGHDVLKSRNHVAYVPFRMMLGDRANTLKVAAMYVRAVSRRDGFRASEEHSTIRDWLARGGGDRPPPRQETVFVGPGELPVGGPAMSSGRQSVRAPAEAAALLALQQRELERQRAAEQAQKKQETQERDPYLFPFEAYYFFDLKSPAVERALSVPPGDYDVFVALIDCARARTAEPTIIRRTITVPDFWNDRLGLSSLILVSEVNTLKAPLPLERQIERPYALGRAEVVPVRTAAFTPHDVLSVVFQMFNFGAPDADLAVDYAFYQHAEGARQLFNRTPTQELTDADLPPMSPWETQAFVSQAVPLTPFPPGAYELEVNVRDRLTRATAKQSVRFSVE